MADDKSNQFTFDLQAPKVVDLEEWRVVPGWPEYSLSSIGRVRRDVGGTKNPALAGRILVVAENRVTLFRGGTKKRFMISELLLDVFGLDPNPDLPGEIWLPFPDWPEYAISSEGRVRRSVGSKTRRAGTMLKAGLGGNGYPHVQLTRGNEEAHILVHRAVARAFHGEPPTADHDAAHNDGNCINNRMENLRWATKKENMADKILHGTSLHGRIRPDLSYPGEESPHAKLTNIQVIEIRNRRANGESFRRIASDYGVTAANVLSIVQRKSWKHLP